MYEVKPWCFSYYFVLRTSTIALSVPGDDGGFDVAIPVQHVM